MTLVKARKKASEIDNTFESGLSKTFDAVVFAMPFSTLREVAPGCESRPPLTGEKFAIEEPRHGTKRQDDGRLRWPSVASLRGATAPLTLTCGITKRRGRQTRQSATDLHAVLTGLLRRAIGVPASTPNTVQVEAEPLHHSTSTGVYPGGTQGCGSRVLQAAFRVHLEHWPLQPVREGSYTSNHPGYFTTIADNEAKPIGNLYLCGRAAPARSTSFRALWKGPPLSRHPRSA